jgi:hypothetical protein
MQAVFCNWQYRYNSLVFTSLATNQYYWSIVTEDFINGAPFNLTGPWQYNDNAAIFSATPPSSSFGDQLDLDIAGMMALEQTMDDYWTDMQQNASTWERLGNRNCMQQYSNVFISGRRSVLLVLSTKNDTNSGLQYHDADVGADLTGNWWICSETGNDGGSMTCNPEKYTSTASNWTVFDYPIEYCLSQPTKDICSVNFSMTIMTVVLSFNVLKVVFMLWVFFALTLRRSSPQLEMRLPHSLRTRIQPRCKCALFIKEISEDIGKLEASQDLSITGYATGVWQLVESVGFSSFLRKCHETSRT